MLRNMSPVRDKNSESSGRPRVGVSNGMSLFATTVRAATAKIPRGKVATYGQIAWMAGRPRAPRAVGQIMSQNKDCSKVPCHRVVASDGSLTGYGMGGIGVKKKKLLAEGVVFRGSRVDLATSLWRPKSRKT